MTEHLLALFILIIAGSTLGALRALWRYVKRKYGVDAAYMAFGVSVAACWVLFVGGAAYLAALQLAQWILK